MDAYQSEMVGLLSGSATVQTAALVLDAAIVALLLTVVLILVWRR